ncbi:hypothetical protein MNKW57_09560 [Biformimicrobium ophioploci]|uniref:Uncharacterized protein n=1 Tax=Biformimicrobium ophioploci TaxID=3036711 RepID=A0ABQ6LX23_9GAMM|nr:hypothetical protein MNKW57_09560 [Microbulbifer sp. NKW57]
MPSLNVSSYILLLTLSMSPIAPGGDNANHIAFLDHAYTILGRETIKELDQSKFLRELAFYEHISHQEKGGVRMSKPLETLQSQWAQGEEPYGLRGT